jgi:hypothetical protein
MTVKMVLNQFDKPTMLREEKRARLGSLVCQSCRRAFTLLSGPDYPACPHCGGSTHRIFSFVPWRHRFPWALLAEVVFLFASFVFLVWFLTVRSS